MTHPNPHPTPVRAARRRFALGLAALAGALAAAPAVAADAGYPDQPIRLVVPFPAGGGADVLARLVMPRVAQELGQPIVIENKPGAGGNVGAEYVARATPNGYTLLYGTNGTHAINHALYANPGFDPVADFEPVSRLTEIAAMLVVTPSLPVGTVEALIRYAKANPGRINFASAGNGTTSHLAGVLFGNMAGIDIVHIPYRGGAAAATDLVAGEVQMMIDVMPNVVPLAQSGRVRGLAVSTARPSAAAPEYPTIAQTLRGFEIYAWDGVFAPAGTPKAIVDRLDVAIRRALADPALRTALLARGAQPAPTTPAEFARFIASEREKWGRVVRLSGAKVD